MFSRYYFYNCRVTNSESAGSRTITGVFRHKSFFKDPVRVKELIRVKTLEGYADTYRSAVTTMNTL